MFSPRKNIVEFLDLGLTSLMQDNKRICKITWIISIIARIMLYMGYFRSIAGKVVDSESSDPSSNPLKWKKWTTIKKSNAFWLEFDSSTPLIMIPLFFSIPFNQQRLEPRSRDHTAKGQIRYCPGQPSVRYWLKTPPERIFKDLGPDFSLSRFGSQDQSFKLEDNGGQEFHESH